MANPSEAAALAAQAKHDARVAATAATLRSQAQAQYDALVAMQQSEMATQMAAVSAHIDTVRAQSQQLEALSPQLDVAYWMTAAEATVAAAEAQGA